MSKRERLSKLAFFKTSLAHAEAEARVLAQRISRDSVRRRRLLEEAWATQRLIRQLS